MPHFPIKIIVLHYSAIYPDQDYGVAEVRKMHLARGFNDVGYHSVIRRDGTIEMSNPDTTVNVTSQATTPAAWTSAASTALSVQPAPRWARTTGPRHRRPRW